MLYVNSPEERKQLTILKLCNRKYIKSNAWKIKHK
jgi:hypothetical protein